MSERRSNLLLPIVIGGVIIASGIGAYYYWQTRQAQKVIGIMGNARLVPPGAIMAASLSTKLSDWQALARFQNTEVKTLIAENTKGLLSNIDIDPVRDLQPWVGPTLLAVLPAPAPQATLSDRYLPTQNKPVPPPPTEPGMPRLVAIIEVKDRVKADRFFTDKVNPKLTPPQTSEEYKGIKIVSSPNYTGAFVDNYFVLATEKNSVKQAIDTFESPQSFAQSLPPLQLNLPKTLIEFYVPDIDKGLQYAGSFGPYSNPLVKSFQEQTKGMVMGIGIEPTGLRLKAVFSLEKPAQSFKTAPGNVLTQFPSETFMLLSSQNLKGIWQQILAQAQTAPQQQKEIDGFRKRFQQTLQMDFDKDIVSWMDGEAAFGLIPSQEGILQQSKSGFAMVFQTSDRKAAQATLDKLDNLSKQLPIPIAIKSRAVDGVMIKEWTSSAAPGVLLGYGWHKPDTLFLAMGSLAEVIAKKSATPLKNSAAFQAIAGTLDTKNQGYVYLDWQKFWEVYSPSMLDNPNVPEPDKKRATAIFTTIRGMGITNSQPENSSQAEVEAFLALAPPK